MVEKSGGGGGGDELRDLVRKLGSTDAGTRLSGLQSFSEFLQQGDLDEAQVLKLWRGLFFGFWYTPGHQAQMEWVTEICKGILDQTHQVASLFWKSFLVTLCREWRGLDQYRLDKFYLLARHLLRAAFVKMGLDDWGNCLDFMDALHECVFPSGMSIAGGLGYHFVDIFLSELREASEKHGLPALSKNHHKQLLSGFAQILMSDGQTDVLKKKVREAIFDVLTEGTLSGGVIQQPFGPSLAKDLKKMLPAVDEDSAVPPDTVMEVEETKVKDVQKEAKKKFKKGRGKKGKGKQGKKQVDLGPTKTISKKGSSEKRRITPIPV